MSKDLMFKDEVQQLVADAYRALDAPGGPAARHYTDGQLAALPDGAREWLLGVGNPTAWAGLRPGEDVADLGCGAGPDTILAAREIGAGGHATGIDLLPEMVERARANAAAAGLDNVTFLQGEIEDVPLADGSVDVVLANGTINLSARKSRVLAEAHRILRPGGRLCAPDLTIREDELPTEVLTHPAAWAG
ncbi:MAG: methyltransferase domain-containing protein [Egibacteraceae bacterium]